MKILFLDRFLGGHDGVSIYLYDAMDHLLRRGHRVGLVYGKQTGDYIPGGLETFRIEDYHTDWIGRTKNRETLAGILRSFEPEVASAQCLDVYWFSRQISEVCPVMANPLTHNLTCPNWHRFYPTSRTVCQKDFGPACVVHNYQDGCGTKNPVQLTKNMLRVAANRATVRYIDAIQAATPYMRQTFEGAGIPTEKIFDLSAYAPFFDEHREYTPPAPRERPLVLAVGRLHQTKGPDLVLEACAKLKGLVDLAFVGAGPMAEELHAKVDALGMTEHCQFYATGIESQSAVTNRRCKIISREEMSKLFFDCSVSMFLSIWGEPFGIVRVETMAHGRPLIGSNAGGTPYCIEDGITGFIVDPLNTTMVAERIKQIVTNPSAAEQMGRAALAKLKREYNPQELTIQLERQLEKMIARRRA